MLNGPFVLLGLLEEKVMGRWPILALVVIAMMVVSGCTGGSGTQTSTAQPTYHSSTATSQIQSQTQTAETIETTAPEEKTWNMVPVWNVTTSGIPFMDMSPDGSLSAVIDFEGTKLYLAKPDGKSLAFDLQEEDPVKPVVAGVAVKDGKAYVLASYTEFSGLRIYSWSGRIGEERHGWAGSVADNIVRSPSGNHLCYLITPNAGRQELYCGGKRLNLGSDEYVINSVSDAGVVVLGIGDRSLVFKEGEKLLELDTGNVIAYGNKLLASEDGKLRVYSLNGTVLAEKEGYTFRMTMLMRWTLIPTRRYIFRYEPLEDTAVLTWNLTEVRTLPGFPYFANENFVVMGDGRTLHCYSLENFHEVFSVAVPDSIGYVRLSDDGKVLLVSGEFGGFWLYTAGP